MAEGDIAHEIKEPYHDEKAMKSNGDENAMTESDELPDIVNCLFNIIAVIALIFFILVYLLYMGAMWLFCNINVIEDKPGHHDANKQGKNTVFQKVQDVQEKAKNLAKLPHVVQSRLVIFVLLWLIVNLTVPKLRNKRVFETKLWKWTLLVTVILCGYHLINVVSKSLIFALCLNPQFKKKKNLVYYVQGLRQSINLVALATVILLTWVSYFSTSRGIKKTDETNTILHICTWSFVTFAVMAVLWLLKSVLLLKWEADAVYRRFSHRILAAGSQIYFLGYICGWRLGVFQPTSEEDKEKITPEDGNNQDQGAKEKFLGVGEVADTSSTKKKEIKDANEEKKRAKRIFFLGKDNKNASLYDIQKMTEYFIDLFKVFSREEDGISEIQTQCKKINESNDPDKDIEVKDLVRVFEFEEADAELLYSRLKLEHKTSAISFRIFEKSMVRAQNNCVALGHTLLDAREVVGVLNNVMVGILFIIVFIAWLLLTDIATTKILVLVASPLLAATFVFGDPCKKIFETILLMWEIDALSIRQRLR